MAVLLEAAGSSRISPCASSPSASLSDRPGPVVMDCLLEQVSAEQVPGVRGDHVGPDVDQHDRGERDPPAQTGRPSSTLYTATGEGYLTLSGFRPAGGGKKGPPGLIRE